MKHDAHGYWIAELGSEAWEPDRPPLEASVEADIAIAGGGYTGMWAAWHAKALQPDARIVLIEAGLCGQGPSGRNGGFVNSLWFSLPTLRKRFGDEGALAVARAGARSIDEIGQWCEAQGVDAWFRKGGYLQASAAAAQDAVPEPAIETLRQLGEGLQVEVLDQDAARGRCGSPLFRGAALYHDAATVQPARLAAGLRRKLIEAGVEIFEGTPMTGLELGERSRIDTPAGAVLADSVVLATGAKLLRVPELRFSLTATSSHMVITEPVPEIVDELGWSGGECVTDSRAMIHYFRTTPDGRIAFGWGGGRIVPGSRTSGKVEVDPAMAKQVTEHMHRFFPQLRGRRVVHAWGGPIDVSPTHLPVIRTIGRRKGARAYAGYGYTGNGVGPSQMIGRSLASLAIGLDDEPARLPLIDPARAVVPPEPFRVIGGSAIRRALLRKERLEEEGRAIDLPTRVVCGIPELIGIHVGR